MAKKDQAQKDSKKHGGKKQATSFAGEVPVETIAAHLDDLARALRDNHVLIQAGKESVDVGVGPRVDLNLKAKPAGKKGKSSLKLTLSWELPQPPAPPVNEDPSLAISSGNGTQSLAADTESWSTPE